MGLDELKFGQVSQAKQAACEGWLMGSVPDKL